MLVHRRSQVNRIELTLAVTAAGGNMNGMGTQQAVFDQLFDPMARPFTVVLALRVFVLLVQRLNLAWRP